MTFVAVTDKGWRYLGMAEGKRVGVARFLPLCKLLMASAAYAWPVGDGNAAFIAVVQTARTVTVFTSDADLSMQRILIGAIRVLMADRTVFSANEVSNINRHICGLFRKVCVTRDDQSSSVSVTRLCMSRNSKKCVLGRYIIKQSSDIVPAFVKKLPGKPKRTLPPISVFIARKYQTLGHQD